ncbi:MAG: hypothetical protein QOE70_235 [Chthoniobacter sp.]|jgi:hypothetical protein|nr:hypothetical protein [Chthoniobacter sp.]
MRRSAPALLLVALALLDLSVRAAEAEPLFNGRDLTGWDGNPRYWSVRDGCIRGETTLAALPAGNTFLIWRAGTLKDFELRLKFRIQNGNSGVQYRSKDLGKWVVSGYQAEIENKQGKAGFLYEEKGRGWLARVGEKVEVGATGKPKIVGQLTSAEELIVRGYYKMRDWNEYRIIARGGHLEHWLNGFPTIDLIDNDPAHRALEGLLALQIHAGPPMIVEFKDILLKNLDRTPTK